LVSDTERGLGEQATVKRCCFISGLKSDAKPPPHAARTHRETENKVHWVLDIAFRDDDCRIRKGNGADNSAVLRHIALNMPRRDTARRSLKAKRKKAGRDIDYLLRVLTG
jgi:predicted transposase YbfD/YdcC